MKAESGTIVSLLVLTAEPVDVVLRPLLAIALLAALRATSPVFCAGPAAAVPLFVGGGLGTTVPDNGWVRCVPLTAPPPVLT